MGLYVKVKTYSINQFGTPIAFIVVKIHPFTMKLKALITLHNGQEYELKNQWATEEEFDMEIEKFIRNKIN
jgi:hypothetical protein